jgi:hypothetical protein
MRGFPNWDSVSTRVSNICSTKELSQEGLDIDTLMVNLVDVYNKPRDLLKVLTNREEELRKIEID